MSDAASWKSSAFILKMPPGVYEMGSGDTLEHLGWRRPSAGGAGGGF